MWYLAAIPVMLLSLAPLARTPKGKAFLCPRLSEDAMQSYPKGWRNGAKNLHSLIGCDGDATTQYIPSPQPTLRPRSWDEDYLKGLIHPGLYFRVDITKKEGEKLGFDISKKGDYLEVEKVHEAGALSNWNKAKPPREVKKSDRIVAINAAEGNATLLSQELRSASSISLRIFRVDEQDQELGKLKGRDRALKKVTQAAGPPGLGVGIPEPSGSKVVTLHAWNIDKFIELQDMALVMFYASWCGHCKQMAPDYTEAAKRLAALDLPRNVKMAKFDDGDEANRGYGAGQPHKFNFTSYPTLKMVNKGKIEPYYGDTGPGEIVAVLGAIAKDLDPETEMKAVLFKERPMMYRPDTDPNDVMDLEPETFDDTVLKEYNDNNAVWIIEFYSDKCPFCASLKPEIVKASKEVYGKHGKKVRFGAINSRAFGDLAKRFGVTSYPWIISVYAGKKIEDMAGLGDASTVVNWAVRMFQSSWKKEPTWSTAPIVAAIDSAGGLGDSSMNTSFGNSTGSWRELLGRRTWFFLHTVAAKYAEEPSEADQAAIKNLVAALGQFYPCPSCRTHLQIQLTTNKELGPVPTHNRQELVVWFCQLHNTVNKKLKKPINKCNAFELDLQYLKSCGECTSQIGAEKELSGKFKVKWDFFKFLKDA